jgi:hypothetical protein
MKTWSVAASAALAGTLLAAGSHGQTQPQAVLAVQIDAAAYFEPPTSIEWRASGTAPTLTVPLNVLLRLNRGADAVLTAFSVDDSAAGSLTVETEAGLTPLGQAPVAVRRYTTSGHHPSALTLRMAGNVQEQQLPARLTIRVASSDNAAVWTETIIVPPAPASVAQSMTPAS